MSAGKFYIILLLIALLAAAVRVYGITQQPATADEIEMAFTAQNYLERGIFLPTMPHHPNLRNLLLSLSMSLFGTGALGVRGFSLLFGTACAPLLGLLLYRLTSNSYASVLAALLLAIDPVQITYSRQAIQEVHTEFFTLAAVLVIIAYMKDGALKRRLWLLPVAGIIFGLALASKAHAFFPLIVCLFYAFRAGIKEKQYDAAILSVLSMTFLPFTVFLLTDALWFLRGYDLGEWFFMRHALAQVMAVKFVGPAMETLVDTRAWEWFIIPLRDYSSFAVLDGRSYVTLGPGNPFVWLLVLPSAAYVVFSAIRRRTDMIIPALFIASYIPLVFARRPIFFLSALAVAPYAYCLVGLAASDMARSSAGRKVIYGWLAAVVIAGVLLYPLSIGRTMDYEYLAKLTERHNPHLHPETLNFNKYR